MKKEKRVSPATRLKELRIELRYWQTMARLEARALKATREKIKEIAALMRAGQKEKK